MINKLNSVYICFSQDHPPLLGKYPLKNGERVKNMSITQNHPPLLGMSPLIQRTLFWHQIIFPCALVFVLIHVRYDRWDSAKEGSQVTGAVLYGWQCQEGYLNELTSDGGSVVGVVDCDRGDNADWGDDAQRLGREWWMQKFHHFGRDVCKRERLRKRAFFYRTKFNVEYKE